MQFANDTEEIEIQYQVAVPVTCKILPYVEVSKQGVEFILGSYIIVMLQHIQRQTFAETTRTGKQGYHRMVFDQVSDHQRFIDKITVPVNQRLEVLHPDGDFFLLFGITHSVTLLSLHTASHFPRAAFFAQLLLLYVIVYWNPPKETSEKQKSAPFDCTDFCE